MSTQHQLDTRTSLKVFGLHSETKSLQEGGKCSPFQNSRPLCFRSFLWGNFLFEGGNFAECLYLQVIEWLLGLVWSVLISKAFRYPRLVLANCSHSKKEQLVWSCSKFVYHRNEQAAKRSRMFRLPAHLPLAVLAKMALWFCPLQKKFEIGRFSPLAGHWKDSTFPSFFLMRPNLKVLRYPRILLANCSHCKRTATCLNVRGLSLSSHRAASKEVKDVQASGALASSCSGWDLWGNFLFEGGNSAECLHLQVIEWLLGLVWSVLIQKLSDTLGLCWPTAVILKNNNLSECVRVFLIIANSRWFCPLQERCFFEDRNPVGSLPKSCGWQFFFGFPADSSWDSVNLPTAKGY